MQDVKLNIQAAGLFDLGISNNDFTSVDGFDTTVDVNIFTDSRAPQNYVRDAVNRRGWIGDILNNYTLGSINWVYDQARITNDTLNGLKISTLNAFQYMIDKKQLEKIDVSVTQVDDKGVIIDIFLTPINAEPVKYSILWKETK